MNHKQFNTSFDVLVADSAGKPIHGMLPVLKSSTKKGLNCIIKH
jgi:hypothetical protein